MACNSALKVVQLGFDGNGDVCRYKNDGHNLAKHTETIHHKNNIIKFLHQQHEVVNPMKHLQKSLN
jgi:hypothetical protein